jgi:hypothetical protein
LLAALLVEPPGSARRRQAERHPPTGSLLASDDTASLVASGRWVDAVRSAALFPGQLSEHVGMGRVLARRSPAAAAVLEEAERHLGAGFRNLLFDGPVEELGVAVRAQCAVATVDAMAYEALLEAGVAVEGAAGFSLGAFRRWSPPAHSISAARCRSSYAPPRSTKSAPAINRHGLGRRPGGAAPTEIWPPPPPRSRWRSPPPYTRACWS